MTLVYELELKILTMYLRSENELSRSKLPKVRTLQTDTDRCDRMHNIATFTHGNKELQKLARAKTNVKPQNPGLIAFYDIQPGNEKSPFL